MGSMTKAVWVGRETALGGCVPTTTMMMCYYKVAQVGKGQGTEPRLASHLDLGAKKKQTLKMVRVL